ncbi:ATP-binding cassette transporter CGR1 [Fusarium oxysporum]|nr:ATP-binding cassette transporter CGR1 [Fusarium oxysporum]
MTTPLSRTMSSHSKHDDDHSDSTADTPTEEPQENITQHISNLARQLSRVSTTAGNELHAFSPQPGTKLDPNSPTFDPRAWVKAFVRLVESDAGAAPPRSLGVAFKNLNVYGWGTGAEHQKTIVDYPIDVVKYLVGLVGGGKKRRVDILRNFEGIVDEGELLLVLGPPGSGCSTLLKTIAGETAGLEVGPDSYMNFRGIDEKSIRRSFRGDVLYNAEIDCHLAHLTVGETLSFASSAHSPRHVPGGVTRSQADTMMRDVMMAIFGISHTVDTRVGSDFVRGVSGGERKRVSIAEAALTGAKLQCWDNTTRGLDSGNAINFCRTLRLQADLVGVAAAVAIYQAPQSAYDLFDRVTVLYEGHQIFFGRINEAKQYFENLGFECPDRQTTPDFLTSMTSPQERRRLEEYKSSRRAEQFKNQRSKSPYTISYLAQVKLTLWRGWRRLLADPGFTIASLIFNLIMALVLGTMFFNLKDDSSSFYYRGGLIFFALLFNAFASQLEVLTVYAERPVVEKHNRYAFYHQSAQAIASYIIDLPYKTINMIIFNLLIYFMAHLRRDAGHFFFFCLTSYLTTLVMSCIYRTLACVTRTTHQAMIPGPGYDDLPANSRICSVVGAEPGSSMVDGDRYINMSFKYYNSNKWRNIGILLGFLFGFLILYIIAAEHAKPPRNKGEVLVFRKGRMPSNFEKDHGDVETQATDRPVVAEKVNNNPSSGLTAGASVFHWEDLCYDIQIKGKDRRLLDHVDGWVKPGKSTALMGVSGAGKTTLLDVLATRVTMGVVSGNTHIDGLATDSSFQHRVGYVQQQDSPPHNNDRPRSPRTTVVGILDEPTSGLDSQTSWAICDLIEKLTASGQAVLCTIHQPSAMLFQRFDRLLLLAPGGKTVYFGDLGEQSQTLLKYFERNGAPPCPQDANPAEYMLEIIKPSNDEEAEKIDWHQIWRDSPEFQERRMPLENGDASQHKEFVASFSTQFREVLIRTWKHFWRSPTYIWSKIALIVLSVVTYIGFTFEAKITIQGLQNQLYAIFMYMVLFQSLSDQIMPMFLPQRDLYEVRERPSKIYRWNTYILSNILVEAAWNTFMAVLIYFTWYYPVGFVRNTTSDDQAIRGFLVFLYLWMFMLFTSTFSHAAIVCIATAEEAGVIATLLWMLSISFCGVGVAYKDIPKFWTFMYRVSPATYIVGGIMSTCVWGSNVKCADNEVLQMAVPGNMTCGDYMGPFIKAAGGYLLDRSSTDVCKYCSLATTEEFLHRFNINYDDRWWHFGLLWVYIFVNCAGALGFYWLFRVPRGSGVKRA